MKAFQIFIFCILPLTLFSQFEEYDPIRKPVPPGTFQFLKYGEIPVNEYNGIPDIKIPIYTIKAGNIEFPIELKYHAGGIRVSEEASWVGLGWDLSFGNITQIVNDRDDLGEYEYIQPDYCKISTPYGTFPYQYPCVQNNPVYPILSGISQTNPEFSVVIYTDYDIPVNGLPTTFLPGFFNASGWSSGDVIDSEPDIFKANFNGHYLEFIINPQSPYDIKVLNRKDYKIFKQIIDENEVGWKIIAPDGIQYYFTEHTKTSYSHTQVRCYEISHHRYDDEQIVSRTWYLTKIESFNNREVSFTYEPTNGTVQEFPSFTQTFKHMETGSESITGCLSGIQEFYKEELSCTVRHGCASSFPTMVQNQTYEELGFSSTEYLPNIKLYVDTIIFPLGKVIFHKSSARMDIKRDCRLDSVEVRNYKSELIEKIVFVYNYFEGTSSGLGYDTQTGLSTLNDKDNDEKLTRLKLISIQKHGEPPYLFIYDQIPLPSKCSYATDYWGFYNGKTTNTSLIANPQDIGLTLGSNGNDHKSDIDYLKAGTLVQIYNPTGGQTIFEYEENTFLTSIANQGNGLRIKSITNHANSNFVSKKQFIYFNGINMLPLSIAVNYGYARNTYFYWDEGSYQNRRLPISCIKILSSNFYSSSLLGSGNGVGYSQVTIQDVDENGNRNGWINRWYHNQQDIISPFNDNLSFLLPACRNFSVPINGSIEKEEIWKNGTVPVQFTDFEYNTYLSEVFYGSRVAFANIVGNNCMFGMGNCWYIEQEQDYVGYFPVYSVVSQVSKKTERLHDLGTTVVTEYLKYYNSNYRKLTQETVKNSLGNFEHLYYTYPYDDPTATGMSTLCSQNRINEPIKIIQKLAIPSVSEKPLKGILKSFNHYAYSPPFTGNQTMLSSHNTLLYFTDPYPSLESIKIVHDDYDNYGNILQYHKENDINTSFVYGYKNSYQVVSAENISFTDLNTAVSAASNNDFQGLLENIGDLTTQNQKDLWNQFNQNLRTNPLVINALLTTYSFKPLVGMTSQTDPAGLTTYYEYDQFGRLLLSRDHQGNIITKYDYHYYSAN
ncbi:MAG: RHS repeat protein [Bacteroidales bacterium]|nr:RHS repeat protein [Bacteroidales bacterium]